MLRHTRSAEIAKLRINAKSLGCELRAIRHELSRKLSSDIKGSLQSHRDCWVRPDARAANLALAFLYGHQYRCVERTARTMPDFHRAWKKIEAMTYGSHRMDLRHRYKLWVEAAKDYCRLQQEGIPVS